jgi:hypothetical protein
LISLKLLFRIISDYLNFERVGIISYTHYCLVVGVSICHHVHLAAVLWSVRRCIRQQRDCHASSLIELGLFWANDRHAPSTQHLFHRHYINARIAVFCSSPIAPESIYQPHPSNSSTAALTAMLLLLLLGGIESNPGPIATVFNVRGGNHSGAMIQD